MTYFIFMHVRQPVDNVTADPKSQPHLRYCTCGLSALELWATTAIPSPYKTAESEVFKPAEFFKAQLRSFGLRESVHPIAHDTTRRFGQSQCDFFTHSKYTLCETYTT